MRRILLISAAAFAMGATGAFADDKPSADEAKKIAAAIEAVGCSGGEMEKESEGSGYFEVDDAKCKNGQFDIKLDKDFNVITMSRD